MIPREEVEECFVCYR